MRGIRTLFSLGLGVLLLIGVALPAQAQGVGAIGGIVTDESGAVLPGVTVYLVSPGVIGGNQNTVSDGQGAYEFARLVPGNYGVRAELQGFRPAAVQNIEVNANRTSRADLKLSIGELSESVEVAAEAPLLDTSSALNQTVMTRDILDTLPTANDVWSIARLAPSVQLSKFDVGGTQMLAQSVAFVHGSASGENAYLIDGMDINSYSGGTGSSINFYLDSFGAQEVNYETGQTPAERQVGGVVINLITKTGTNAFRGSGMFQGTNHNFQANNISGQLKTDLLAGVPASALAANPNINPGNEITHLFEVGNTLSGAVIPDKLWYSWAFKWGEAYQYQLGSYDPNGQQLLVDNRVINTSIKGSMALNQSSQLHYSDLFVVKDRLHQAGGPQVTEFFETRAAFRNPSKNHVMQGRYTNVLTSRMVLDVAGSDVLGQTNRLEEPEVKHGDIPHFDSVTRTNSVGVGTYNYDNGQRQNIVASITYAAATHDIKGGYQYVHTPSGSGGYSISHYPAGLRAVFANGVPTSVNTYNTPVIYTQHIRENALYLQDKWRVTNRLTVNLGVRAEQAYGWINDGESPICQVQTVFIAGQCFPAVKGAPDNLWTVVPRTGAVYDLRGDGRSVLKFSGNRYANPTGTSWVSRLNPIARTSDTRAWTVCAAGQTSACDLNGDKEPQLNELGPSTGFNLGTTNRNDPDLKRTTVNEYSVEWEQQLPMSIVLSTGFYYRGRTNNIAPTNLAVPLASWTPITITEVVSGRQVTVYNQDATLRGKNDTIYKNIASLDSTFKGVDITLQKRMANHWMVMGSASFSSSDAVSSVDQNNPNLLLNSSGPEANERPFFFKMAGAYEAPKGISFGLSGQYFQGVPETTTVSITSQSVRLTQVSQTLTVDPPGTVRLPNLTAVDFNVRKSFGSGQRRIEPRLDVFNMFNSAAVTNWIAQLGPTYHRAIEIIGGRLFKFGVNVTW